MAVPHRLDRLVCAHAAEIHQSRRDARVPERVAHDVERCSGAHEVNSEGVPELSPCACTRRSIPALRASLGSKCRTYDWSICLPASVQKSGAPYEAGSFRRSSGGTIRPD